MISETMRFLFALLLSLIALSVEGQDWGSAADLNSRVGGTVQSGQFDTGLISDIKERPANERGALAAKLVDSSNAAMRRQTILIFQEYPPKVQTS